MEQLNEIDELKDALNGRDIDVDRLTKQRDEARQQLAAALAAIKSKDVALQSAISAHGYESGDLHDALAVQPDESALKAWLGEPVGWAHSCPVLCLDGVELWIDRCPHCGKPAPKWRTK